MNSMKSLVGISCCSKPFGLFAMANHAASDTYVRAVDQVIGAVPILIPANGGAADVETLIARLDGLLLTGSRSNVQPCLYGGPPHADGTPEDPARDAVTLPLIREAIAAGLPLLAVCRGLQELNVALGGTLHQMLQDLPDHFDHSTPMQPNAHVRQGKAHPVKVLPGTWLRRVTGLDELPVNSLHNQGIATPAPGLITEAVASDGTIEAVRVANAPGFAVGVQWHPEYDFETDATSQAIFRAFGDAVADYVARRHFAAGRVAA